MQIGVSGYPPVGGWPATGTVTVNFTSKAVGGSGLSDTALASQTLTLSGDVYDYAAGRHADHDRSTTAPFMQTATKAPRR